jgi:hypothetical protein
MKHLRVIVLFAGVFAIAAVSNAAELSAQHRKELSVFGMRAMGLKVGVGDVKNVPSRSEIEQVVAVGLNANGHLCAQIVEIRPLRLGVKIMSGFKHACDAG